MKLLRNSPEHIEAVRHIEMEFGRELNEMELAFLDAHPQIKTPEALEDHADWQDLKVKWEERRRDEYLDLIHPKQGLHGHPYLRVD
jgi:hypothetical protein